MAPTNKPVTGSQQAVPASTRRKLKVAVACQNCRRRKVKCDGGRPACSTCRTQSRSQARPGSCSYRGTSSVASEAAARQTESSSQERPPTLHHGGLSDSGPVSLESSTAHDGYGHALPDSSAAGRSANDLNTAVTTRIGPPSAERPTLLPVADVPLFGLLGHPDTNKYHGIENVLPSREDADKLLDIFWRYIQPLEPFVDKKTLLQSYEALVSDKPVDQRSSANQRILLSTLNAIFALATQLQESLARDLREETSRTYFHRAWALLRPDALIWEPASLEAVQCMLLLGRYLQCTNHWYQTWMAVGSAVRAAQSLGLDSPQAAVGVGAGGGRSGPNEEQRQRVWQCCVFMDRTVSWAFGRVSMVPLTIPGAALGEGQDANGCQQSNYLSKTLDLYEIVNRATLSQDADRNGIADRMGVSRLSQEHDSGVGMVMQLDDCIATWEKCLPQSLNFGEYLESQVDTTENIVYRQAVLLRLRLFHARITLFKPTLARYCSSSQVPRQGLKDKVIRDCAVLCIENAQQMVDLVCREHNSGVNLDRIGWWQRFFYLYVAGTVLLAAMLRADDLFTHSVSKSWEEAMQALRAHAHLSDSVQQCLSTFETLSEKISETQQLITARPAEDDYAGTDPLGGCDGHLPALDFQNVFQDWGIDLDSCLFGVEDMAWNGNLF